MSEEYDDSVTKAVVALLCKELGFSSISDSALHFLSMLLQHYITEIGKRAHLYSELSCRTEANFLDVLQTLKDMKISLDDLYNFAVIQQESPTLNKVIPEFPIKKETLVPDENKSPPPPPTNFPPHIPNHLPAFPLPHSYRRTPIIASSSVARDEDAKETRKRKQKEKRDIETSLAKLNDKLGNNPILNYDSQRKQKTVNPYLVPPKLKESKNASSTPSTTTNSGEVVPMTTTDSHLKTVFSTKLAEAREYEESRPVIEHTIDEAERLRKRQRAEQIFSLEYQNDMIDLELPNTQQRPNNTSGPNVEKI